MNSNIDPLAELLRETGKAHHQAFLATDGADAEWPLWYAEYLEERIPTLVGARWTRSGIVHRLVEAERQHSAAGSSTPWPEFYAESLLAASD